MTDQPPDTAAPTPGPWKLDERMHSVLIPSGLGSCYVAYGGTIANARLIAAAPATAAERDRLQLEIEQCHAKSTCCCGDYMKQHSTQSGHNRVSMYDNALFNVEAERDRLRAALQQAEEGAAIIVGQISAPQDGLSPETTAWVVRQALAVSNRARAALGEARTPPVGPPVERSPEGEGG